MFALRDAFDGTDSLRDAFERACDGGGGGGDIPADPPNEWQTLVSTRGPAGTRPTNTEGTAVTPGTGGAWGAYADLGVLHATEDMQLIEIVVHSTVAPGTNRQLSIEIATDEAGGTAYTNIVSDLLVGTPGQVGGGTGLEGRWAFPIIVPAGATIGVRATSLDATVTAFRVYVNGFGNPSRPELVAYGTSATTFGVPVSGTVIGTAVVPGALVDGAWVEVGTLPEDMIYFEFGYLIDDPTMTSGQIDVDVALGDVGTERIIIRKAQLITVATETNTKRTWGVFARGAAGEKIFVRSQSSVAADTNNSAAVYGVAAV